MTTKEADWKIFLAILKSQDIDPITNIATEQQLGALMEELWKESTISQKTRAKAFWKNVIKGGSGNGTPPSSLTTLATTAPAPPPPTTTTFGKKNVR